MANGGESASGPMTDRNSAVALVLATIAAQAAGWFYVLLIQADGWFLGPEGALAFAVGWPIALSLAIPCALLAVVAFGLAKRSHSSAVAIVATVVLAGWAAWGFVIRAWLIS